MNPLRILVVMAALAQASMALANVPGGIISSSTTPVTLSVNPAQTSGTMGNGIVQIVFSTSGAVINQINYTYNNGSGTVTKQMLLDGKDGGELYWEFGGFGGSTWTYTDVVDPGASGTYGEIAFTSVASGSAATGDLQVNFSMLKGSPGFYVTLTMMHHAGDIATGLGEMRTNIYLAPDFNWMSVSSAVQRELGINATFVPAFDSPQENSLCVSGVNQGLYDDKYKFSQLFGTERVWGWCSVSDSNNQVFSGADVGIWNILASSEYYNGGPLKPELMDAPMVNMLNGGHYEMGADSNWAQDEQWTRVQGPYFVYCNNISNTITDPVQSSRTLYNDAVAQGAAEATAWPYSWYNNPTYDSNYVQAPQRSTVTGQIVVSDTGNPNASGSNMWVGVIQQPSSPDGVYDFQEWYKPYQFWVKTDGYGNFTIPAVISGSNYTLWAFGPGAEGTFLSQNQTGGNPPLLYNLPATPFSVTVTAGTTTNLGPIVWTPTRVGATVFEIGYPDRTGHKFRHGDDWWVGDIGPSPTEPSPIWTKFFELPFDFPNGVNYTVGVNQWPTDWFFIQPILVSTAGGNNSSSSTINFTLPSAPAASGSASLYLGIASDYYGAVIVTVNGTNLGSTAGVNATPHTIPSTGFIPSYTDSDTSIREECNAAFSDERITFPASLLLAGSNTITLALRQVGGSYFANHFMYDYIRLELTGYVPPPPASVSAYAGNNSVLLAWPVTPGATSYNVLRSVTSGTNYSAVASGSGAVIGQVCGSGPSNATYVDTTATNGKTYYYVLQSVNTTGTSGNSPQSAGVTPSSGIATTAPATPTGVTVAGNNGNVAITWSASPGANYYTIQRSTITDKIPNFAPNPMLTATSTVLSTITLTNSTTQTAYTDYAVTQGTKYTYTVQATNAAGSSGRSTALLVKPVPSAAPPAPSGISTVLGAGQVTLNWPAVPGAVGYIIQVGTSSGGPYTFLGSVSDLTYTETGLVNDTTYYYIITAVNEAGATNSSQITVRTQVAPPSNLAAMPGNTQVTLTWTANADATSYNVSRGSANGGPYTMIGTSPGPSYTDTGLTNGTNYFYVVQAVATSGTSGNSSQVNAVPTAAVPVAPMGLMASGSNEEMLLNWTASAGATGYVVYRAVTNGGPFAAVSSGLDMTTFTDTGLSDSTKYYYVVAATNSSGTSAYSVEASGTTLPGPLTILTWDNLGESATDPQDGSAGWDAITPLWSNGTTDFDWGGNTAGYEAVFGNDNGAAGTVTAGDMVMGGLVFDPPGSGNYTITSGTLELTGSAPAITANVSATIGSVLTSGTVVTIDGLGTLTLTAPATFTSNLNLEDVTVDLAGPSYSAMLGTGTLNLENVTIVNLTANPNASVIDNPVYVGAGETANIIFSSRTVWTAETVTGAGTLNLYSGSNLAGSRADLYTYFDAFNGIVNINGTLAGAAFRYFLVNGQADGSANAVWNIGGPGTDITILPQTNTAGNLISFGALGGGANGTLSGGSAGPVTYSIGGLGLNSTFAGGIGGNAAVTKVGGGTQILSGSCSYTGLTSVLDGVLEITGSLSNTSGLTISSGAVYYQAGGSLSVSGTITNNGIFKISGSPSIALTGMFINNGVLDLINATTSLPPNFVNNGTVLEPNNMIVQQLAMTGTTFNVGVQSYVQHNYQLQRTLSISNPSWTNVGLSQAGTGGTITLTDPGATGKSGIYRVQVNP